MLKEQVKMTTTREHALPFCYEAPHLKRYSLYDEELRSMAKSKQLKASLPACRFVKKLSAGDVGSS
jgi:hypothetical protein